MSNYSGMTFEEAVEEQKRLYKFSDGCLDINGTLHLTANVLERLMERQWVSVKDRLPKYTGYYLCTYISDGHRFYYDRWFNGKEFTTTDNVTHWMPLPALLKEEDGKNG